MATRNAASMGTHGASWESHGYAGGGSVSELINSLAGRPAIIAGNGNTVFQDMERAQRLLKDPVIFAVNDIGMYLPVVHHWASLHADKLGIWRQVRWAATPVYPTDPEIHSHDTRPIVKHVWENLTPMFALSGYFAMQIAYIMGAGQIVLCGCPGSSQRRFFEGSPTAFGYGGGNTGSDAGIRDQVIHEMNRLPEFKAKVRSLSGWSREFFGGLRG